MSSERSTSTPLFLYNILMQLRVISFKTLAITIWLYFLLKNYNVFVNKIDFFCVLIAKDVIYLRLKYRVQHYKINDYEYYR